MLFVSGNNTYTYDINAKKFDSLNTLLTFISGMGAAFKVDSTYYIAGSSKENGNDYLYYSKNLFDKNPLIDSLEYNEAFHSEGYKIMDSKRLGNIIYLLIGEAFEDFLSISYRANYIKIYDDNSTSATEKLKPLSYYLWASNPYPNPGKNLVRIDLFWTNDLSGENISFDIYDYLGAKVNAEVSLERSDNNNGTICLNTAGLPKGVYVIMVNFQSRSLPVRVAVE